MFLWFTTGCLTCYLNVFILKLDVSYTVSTQLNKIDQFV